MQTTLTTPYDTLLWSIGLSVLVMFMLFIVWVVYRSQLSTQNLFLEHGAKVLGVVRILRRGSRVLNVSFYTALPKTKYSDMYFAEIIRRYVEIPDSITIKIIR